ncbi:MAG: crossover junction endodeoxyribonuclease RuvC [Rikenellaceae bacterium]
MAAEESYRLLGIDPGTNYMGYGVVEISRGEVRGVEMGVLDIHRLDDPYLKLKRIFDRVVELVDEFAPQEVALESPFFGENVQSMLKLGRAQGVAMAAALSRQVDVFEYAPTKVKLAVTGRGSASKEELAAMVGAITGLDVKLSRLDATDAVAVAICHYLSTSTSRRGVDLGAKSKGLGGGRKSLSRSGSKSWEQFVKENPGRELKK